MKNFFKPSKSEPEGTPLKNENTNKQQQQQEAKQKKPEPSEEQRRQAEAKRKELEEQQEKQRNVTSDKPLSASVAEAFDKFKSEHHSENDAVKRTDNSMRFPNKESAVELMEQQAEKNQAFELGDVAKDFYVFSDGRGNFYKGNKEGLDTFKQELQEQHQEHKENFNPVLAELNTGLSALPEHRDEVNQRASRNMGHD